VSARDAHAFVGAAVRAAEESRRTLNADDLAAIARDAGLASLHAPLDARASVDAKATSGSTAPAAVRAGLAGLAEELDALG